VRVNVTNMRWIAAVVYWMSSSARSRDDDGIVSVTAFAVLVLLT
jgi:hypothetical protein